VDYTIFFKDSFNDVQDLSQSCHWDVFISAYNTTDRVQQVFEGSRADDKRWVVHAEYGFQQQDLPTNPLPYAPRDVMREDDFILGFMDTLPPLDGKSICIDISGFMRPHLMFLMRALAARGRMAVDALYSEPIRYAEREETEFTQGDVTVVRPIAGFEGTHSPAFGGRSDLLIIGAGYEHHLMRYVASAKGNTRKLQLLGFPSLQADFYQENVLNAERASEAVSAINEEHPLYAPASDPFVTANVLHETIERERQVGINSVYLCPLSSRPQALGFALYYLYEGHARPVSVIYPFASRYARDAASGLARIWRYKIEFP
jgi:hypothetical protein